MRPRLRHGLFALPSKDDLRSTLRLTLFLVVWVFGIITAVGDTVIFSNTGLLAFDSHAYWLAGQAEHPYGRPPGSKDAFLYSPVFAQLMRLPAMLPWTAFALLWMALIAIAFFWLTAPLPWSWRIPVLLGCVPELLLGNIYAFLGVAVVLGMRHPQFWAFPLLTKVAPGGLGLLWFVARGEWRKVFRILWVTSLIAAVSFLFEPMLWTEWIRFLRVSQAGDESFLLARAAVASAAVLVAARLDKAWCLPLAIWLAAPVFSTSSRDLAILPAAIRLWPAATDLYAKPDVTAVKRPIGSPAQTRLDEGTATAGRDA